MTQKFRLYRRSNGRFYAEDNVIGKQESLRTFDRAEALRLVMAKTKPSSNLPSTSRSPARISPPAIRRWRSGRAKDVMDAGRAG
jgi:hypothetical protein